jgi:ubiquinol-cytochrome c reductase cytochrome b subunit
VRDRLTAALDWFHSRTGYRTGRAHLLDEPIPAGTGWWFVTGSILLALLSIQIVTGIVLAMYYVPSPGDAYDSVRFIMERLTLGHVLRSLHYFGASFIVIAAVVHLLRVVAFASYKKPRELNWVVGVLLLFVILGFALTGYLLPWDQRAYWATTVTINIARSGPFGDFIGRLMRGGIDLGALTLLRWYAVHVFVLPATLILFTLAHLFLMRRQGISGPVTPVPGPSKPFYPYHAVKDTIVVAAVFALLLTFAIVLRAPLDEAADPTGAGYIPRPEWYFLFLFQLLKFFPGRLEPIATFVIPGVVVLLLLLMPFLDRDPERRPQKRGLVMGAFGFGLLAIGVLTYLGMKDSPLNADPQHWGLMPIAGREFVAQGKCETCHRDGGAASPINETRIQKEPEWLLSHVRDPKMIAPGLEPPPRGGINEAQSRAILSYVRKLRTGATAPNVTQEMTDTAILFGSQCALCHTIDGEGASGASASGPDLTGEGKKHDAEWLRKWISDPESVDPKASMPAFGDRISDQEMTLVVSYLARQK